MANSDTIIQHYVPRAFLSRWCIDDQFYPIKIISKFPPCLDILKKTGVYPFCAEKYFYADKQGKRDNFSQEMEDCFTKIENNMYPILDSFEDKVLNNKQISFDDKYQLAFIMLIFNLRGKKYLDWSKELSNEMAKKTFEMSLNYRGDDYFKKIDLTKEEIIEINKNTSIDFGTAHHLKMFKSIPEFAFFIAKKYWKISVSKSNDFIVTDTPYLDLPVKQEGSWGNDIFEREQYFMFSSKIHISMLSPKDINAKNVNRKDVTDKILLIDRLNLISLMNSVLFGFHSDEKVLSRVKKSVYAVYQNRLRDVRIMG